MQRYFLIKCRNLTNHTLKNYIIVILTLRWIFGEKKAKDILRSHVCQKIGIIETNLMLDQIRISLV